MAAVMALVAQQACGATIHLSGTVTAITPSFVLAYDDDVILDNAVNFVSSLNSMGVTFNGQVSGLGGLRFTSGGVLYLNATQNSFGGGVNLSRGNFLHIAGPGSLGSGPLTVTSKAFVEFGLTSGASTTISNPIVINSSESGTGPLSFWSAAGAAPGHQVNMASLTVNGAAMLALDQTTGGGAPDLSWNLGKLQLGGTLTLALGSLIFTSNFNPNNTDIRFYSYAPVVSVGALQETSPSVLSLDANYTVVVNGTSNLSGGVLNRGAVIANAAGALGTAPVNNATGTLTLNATNAAGNAITGGLVFYNANGAAGGQAIQGAEVRLGAGVTGLSNGSVADGFVNLTGLRGSTAALALFDRGIGAGTANVTFAPLAAVENTDGALPAVQHLGGNADLTLYFGQPSALPVTVGAGTPWGRLYATSYRGMMTAQGDFSLDGQFVGGTDSAFQIVTALGVAPVQVQLLGDLGVSLANYSGVAKFNVTTAAARLSADNALGGGGGTAVVPLDVSSTGNLTVASAAALNAAAYVHGGGTLTVGSAGLTGTGVLARDAAPVTIALAHAGALAGSQWGGFIHPGDTVILAADNIANLGTLNPGLNFGLPTGGTVSQSGVIHLNGSSLLGPGVLQAVPGADLVLQVGAGGASLGGGSNTLRVSARMDAVGAVTILAAGLGFPSVILDNTGNQFQGAINVNGTTLTLTSPGAATGAMIQLSGGTLWLRQLTGTASAQYNNLINVPTDSGISGDPSSPTASGSTVLSHVALGNATLTLGQLQALPGLTISKLTLTGNGVLVGQLLVGTNSITLGDVEQEGAVARSLNLMPRAIGGVSGFIVQGSVTATGPITSSALLDVEGTVTRSDAALTVQGNGGVLSGRGSVLRPVTITQGAGLVPGNYTQSYPVANPGTLMVDALVLDSSAKLNWDLGEANVAGGLLNDLVVVNGDLTLDGTMGVYQGTGFGPGRFTLFTYGGALHDQGLQIPNFVNYQLALDLGTPGEVALVVSAVPEPGTLALVGGVMGLLLMRRRRRGKG